MLLFSTDWHLQQASVISYSCDVLTEIYLDFYAIFVARHWAIWIYAISSYVAPRGEGIDCVIDCGVFDRDPYDDLCDGLCHDLDCVIDDDSMMIPNVKNQTAWLWSACFV